METIKKFLTIFFIAFFVVFIPVLFFSGLIWLIATYTSGILSTILTIALLAFIIAIAVAIAEIT